MPKPLEFQFAPKVYGFKVYGRKGSKYEEKREQKELTYYTQEDLKKLRTVQESKK